MTRARSRRINITGSYRKLSVEVGDLGEDYGAHNRRALICVDLCLKVFRVAVTSPLSAPLCLVFPYRYHVPVFCNVLSNNALKTCYIFIAHFPPANTQG